MREGLAARGLVGTAPVRLAGGAVARFTERGDGDLSGTGPECGPRRQAIVDLPWTALRQVHGSDVVVVTEPGAGDGREADGAVTGAAGAALAVRTADCAPIVLASDEGVIGAAHAGWRGLAAGVVAATVDAMRHLGAERIHAVIGPCIQASCYRFGADDLEEVVAVVGAEVRGRDRDGAPALDLPAGVAAALRRSGVGDVVDVGVCTACSAAHWSWRAAGDRERQATVVWRP